MTFLPRNISIVVLSLAVAAIGVLVFMIERVYERKAQQKLSWTTVPSLNLELSDSSFLNASDLIGTRPTLIVLFNSDCDYCSDEARDISDHARQLTAINTFFISVEELTDIIRFGNTHQLAGHEHIYLAKADPVDFNSTFGVVSFPRIMLYGADGKLAKDFSGVTKVESILKYLPQ